jgi:uncharacterized protein (TIGR02099 family)
MIWRRRIHRARLCLQALFAAVVIALAVVVGLAQIGLPWLVSHPEKISAFLSSRLDRAVTIEHVDAHWESNGPLLILHGVRILAANPAQPPSLIPQAELKINFFSWLHRNQAWNEFRLVGLDLHLARDAAGHWRLRGLDAGSPANQGSDNSALFDLGALVLRDLRFSVDDAAAGRHIALAADEVRLVNSGNRHRVLAQVRCLQTPAQPPLQPLDVVIEYDSSDRSGEIYLGGQRLDLAAITHGFGFDGLQIEQGKGRVQAWAWWQRGRLMRARSEIDLADVVLTTQSLIALDAKRQIAPRVGFDHVALGARWQRGDNGWQADIADLVMSRQGQAAAPANIHVEKYQNAETARPDYSLSAGSVDFAAPASVAMLSAALPPEWRRWLYIANPVGVLRSATLRYGDAQDFDVAASFAGVAWHAVDKLPGASGLGGDMLGDQDAFSFALPAHTAVVLDQPRVFRKPLEFSEFAGDIAAYRGDAGWRVETDALAFEGAGYGGQLRGAIQLYDDGSRPLLDAYAVVTHAEVPASHLFWPINIMPPAAVAWLDHALVSGRIDGARAVIRGDLADWPFRNYAGRFEARADIDDARLVYLPDWPAAEHLHSAADFVNTSLHLDMTTAQALGNKVEKATADIADLGEPVLELDVGGSGPGKNLLAFIKATPIGQQYAVQLLGVGIGGNAKLDFHLHLPIKHTEDLDLAGNAMLTDADLADAKYQLRLNKANGKVRFSQHGFSANDLAVTMNAKPATFNLAVGGFVADPRHAVEANLRASAPVSDLLAYAPILSAWADHVSGGTVWSAGFSADGDSVKNPGQRLTLASDLRGVAVDLPAPLRKSADAALPLSLTLGVPFAGGSIDLHIADLLHLRGRMASPTLPFAARVDFGADSDAPLPAAGFSVGGNAPQLDLSGWMDFAAGSGGSNDLLAGVDLAAQSLRAWDRDFGAAQFKLVPGKDGLELGFNGANVAGTLHIPAVDLRQRGITAQFTKLYWPESPESETSALAGENPAAVPPLHIRIGDFHLGHSTFGDTTLESYPIADGTHFEQVSTHSNNVEMRAHGDWTGHPGSDVSKFSIDFSAHNLGHMLDAFGYAGVVDGGATVAHIEGSWSGSPSTFALARLNGTLKASVQEGRIPNADPGAGRIFGLFNLGAIPRRLTLDFGDFFKSGFSFDSIDGLFTLKDGNAFTSNLQVKGPAADISVNGRTGLRTKDYDQVMIVTPHVGGTLMIGGALVGGPVGAAAGAVLQGIFKNQLNAAARTRYSVTGSWEKPVFTVQAEERIEPVKPAGKDAGKSAPRSRAAL